MDKLVRNQAVQTSSAPKPQAASHDFPSTFPGGITPDTLFDPRTETIVGCFADRLVATGAFRQHERQDIAQNFRLLLLGKMPAFKPELKDRYGYAAMVIANGFKNELKSRDRKLKRTGGFLSLQDKLDEAGDTVENHVNTDDYLQLIGAESMSAETRYFCEESWKQFKNSLTDEDRWLCDCLMECGTIEKTARRTALPASTIRWRLRTRISHLAVQAGLDDFCGGAK
jgi:hypothetical protein